ncbi:unnamed protein product [Discosporangium mesarthrocarpum]
MQEIKDRKERLEERKERREVEKERREELGVQEDLSAFDIKAQKRAGAKVRPEDLVRVDFDDGHTLGMFGDTVTVTTTAGIPDSDDEDGGETAQLEAELRKEKRRRQAQKLRDAHGAHRGAEAGSRAGAGAGAEGGKGEEPIEENNWSLAAVTKRLAAKMPPKSRKAPPRGAEGRHNGGKKGKKGGGKGGPGGGSVASLMDKARGGLPRSELGGRGKKLGKKKKRK